MSKGALMRIKCGTRFPFEAASLANREDGIPTETRSPGSDIVFVPVTNSPACGDSPGLVSLHVAYILARKFSIVTMWERWVPFLR